jgi:hypothetical protein
MYRLEDILADRSQDKYGNTHFVVKGKLVASFLPQANLICPVDIKIEGEKRTKRISVSYTGATAVVYNQQIATGTSVLKLLSEADLFRTYEVFGAINGLKFSADLMPLGWRQPQMPSAQSKVTLRRSLNNKYNLARDLVLYMTHASWNGEFIKRYQTGKEAFV